MKPSSDLFAKRRKTNASALSAFGVDGHTETTASSLSVVAEGSGPTVFTVGYEKRSGDELISILIDAGVDALVDVRQRAMSRKADFRGKALNHSCEEAGISYIAMPQLGSTDELRDGLRETGDFKEFSKKFKSLARRKMKPAISDLADTAKDHTVALLCYERCHSECHRSVLADFLHKDIDAHVVAL